MRETVSEETDRKVAEDPAQSAAKCISRNGLYLQRRNLKIKVV